MGKGNGLKKVLFFSTEAGRGKCIFSEFVDRGGYLERLGSKDAYAIQFFKQCQRRIYYVYIKWMDGRISGVMVKYRVAHGGNRNLRKHRRTENFLS